MTSEHTSAEDVYMALKYRVKVDKHGTRYYFNSAGQLHREEGPAVILTDGPQVWYQNSLRHRTDGPAVDWGDGYHEWWLQGVQYTESDYRVALAKLGIKT